MQKELKPAIVVAGYNRFFSLKRVLDSVVNAHYDDTDITLIISLDYCPENSELVEYAENLTWNYGKKVVRAYKERQGLRQHILQCGDLALEYGAVICLEDDLIVAPDFYQYIKRAFEYYRGEKRICGVALYSHRYNAYAKQAFEPIKTKYDAYIGQISVTWGQGWTAEQWKEFRQWYEKNKDMPMEPRDDMPIQFHRWKESWSKYFAHYMVLQNKYYVLPYYAFSTCFADKGEHTGKDNCMFQVPLYMGKGDYNLPEFEKAEKYDIFFENMDIARYLGSPFSEQKICCDLFGIKNVSQDYDYMLTVQQIDKQIVKSYGLKMFPMELNIIYNVQGNTVWLYDLHSNNKAKPRKVNEENLLDYRMRFISGKQAVRYIMAKGSIRLKQKLAALRYLKKRNHRLTGNSRERKHKR